MATDKTQWPSDLQGYSIGKDGFLLVAFTDNLQDAEFYEIDIARDVSIKQQVSSVDTTCKRTGFVRTQMPFLLELSADAEMLFDATDECYQMLVKASRMRRIFYVGVLTDDGEGPFFRAFLSSFDRSEPLLDIVKVNATFQLVSFLGWSSYALEAVDETHPHYNQVGQRIGNIVLK